MKALLVLALALGSLPCEAALACQSTTGEIERYLKAQRERRNHADVVVIGTWRNLSLETECKTAEPCASALVVVEKVERGRSQAEYVVRFDPAWEWCEENFDEVASETSGRFYLNLDRNGATYALADFEPLESEGR